MRQGSYSWSKMRERGGGMLFTLALNGLLLLAMLTLAPHFDPPEEEARLPVTFDIAAAPEAKTEEKEAEAKKGEEEQEEQAPEPEPQPEKQPQPEPEPQPVDPLPVPRRPVAEPLPPPRVRLPFIELSRDQMASADIGRMPKGVAAGTQEGKSSAAAAVGPGEGPGGVQLYDAQWFRRPTHAELASYIPANAPAQGWGLVACKTIENNRVENCQAIGESPVGSGLARAVRLAAWQFMVLPPRVNGKPMVGSWVRIRIDYSQSPAPATGGGE